jgi:hypothetical protein
MKIFLLFYIILFAASINAQELYFCKSVTENGKPVDAELKWEIQPFGTRISILYQSNNFLNDQIYYLFIDKKFDNEYKPFDSKTNRPDKQKKWMEFEFSFKEEGEYKIYIMDSEQKVLAQNYLSAFFSGSYNSIAKKSETSYSYYDDAKIIFSERVFSNKPYNSFRETSLSQNNGEVYIFIDNGKPLNTDVILVYIYQKKNRAFEYDEFVDSKKFKIDENWKSTFFKYKFEDAGDYKFAIFNQEEKPIKNGFIKVR